MDRELAYLVVIDHKLSEVLRLLKKSASKEAHMAGELDALRVEVEENTSVTGSAVVLLTELKAKLDAAIAAGDWNEVKNLSDALSTNTDSLAAAVAANTPAAP